MLLKPLCYMAKGEKELDWEKLYLSIRELGESIREIRESIKETRKSV